MNWYRDYKLIKCEDGYTVVIYLNPHCPEFSDELISNVKENILELDDQIKKFMDEKFSNIKVSSIKLMLGALVVGTIPFMPHAKVQAAAPSTKHQTATQRPFSGTTRVVHASRLNVRSGPSTSHSVIHKLPRGTKITIIGESKGWYKIRLSDGRTGWISRRYLRLSASLSTHTTSKQKKVNTVISSAKALLGTPYVWGGESLKEGGFDCSGFTKYVFNKAGYRLNRVSHDQAKQGIYVSRADLQPGDLVFFSISGNGRISHIGIYIGDGRMIHSPKTGDKIKITNINSGFWRRHYVTARRIIH